MKERVSADIGTWLRHLLGSGVELKGASPVSGGSINEACRLDTTEGPFFLKRKRRAPAGFFACEARGLELLRRAGAQVPAVIGWLDVDEEGAEEFAEPGSAYLLLEWLDKAPWTPRTMEELGRSLARVHGAGAPALSGPHAGYGLDGDSYIGELPQPNRIMDDWTEFYRACRLQPQFELGLESGRIAPGSQRARRLEYVIRHLDKWIPRRPEPSLLHGDLWAGNAMAARSSGGAEPEAWFLDPSVCVGHHEVDLAFSEYFGGFSPAFYAAYREAHGLDGLYAERKPLYQLYYLLVHLNLFGEGYGAAVDSILRRYAP